MSSITYYFSFRYRLKIIFLVNVMSIKKFYGYKHGFKLQLSAKMCIMLHFIEIVSTLCVN